MVGAAGTAIRTLITEPFEVTPPFAVKPVLVFELPPVGPPCPAKAHVVQLAIRKTNASTLNFFII
jgi:hypothetical protein